jgi:hypothetical protein
MCTIYGLVTFVGDPLSKEKCPEARAVRLVEW